MFSNHSPVLNLRAVTCLAATPLLCASRAAIAPSVRDAPLGMPARDERLLYSIPTKEARSAERLLLNRCVRRRFVGSSGLRKGGILNSESRDAGRGKLNPRIIRSQSIAFVAAVQRHLLLKPATRPSLRLAIRSWPQ